MGVPAHTPALLVLCFPTLFCYILQSLLPLAGSTSAAGGWGLLEVRGLVGIMVREEEVDQ